MILRESAGVIATGVSAGSALAYMATRLIASRLYDVGPHDPATLAAALGGLLMVAGAAAYLPARRAATLNPMTALHHR